jgi:TATA-binding protein-associated factor
MPSRSLKHVHGILLDMAQQSFTKEGSAKPYIWQVRHGGMLGLKYEVAVRRDLLLDVKDEEMKANLDTDPEQLHSAVDGENGVASRHEVLRSVVSSAVLG